MEVRMKVSIDMRLCNYHDRHDSDLLEDLGHCYVNTFPEDNQAQSRSHFLMGLEAEGRS